MGHWGINEEDPENDEIWGDQEADIFSDYLEYLKRTNPERLKDREALIEDLSVLVWEVLYELEEGRAATRAELEYGVDWSFGECNIEKDGSFLIEKEDDLEENEVDEEHIKSDWDDDDSHALHEYLQYLKEMDPERLNDKERLLKDVRLLTWEAFDDLRSRIARDEEIEYIFNQVFPREKEEKTVWGALGKLFRS